MDRISDLPDQILTQILSLLPAEEVARTMILSKRWQRVWASVPVLFFDNYDITNSPQRNAKFLPFVKCFLDRRENLPLDKFHLEWRGDFSAFLPYGFRILSGMTLFMPKVISICIYTDEYFRLPDSVFTCASVEKMSLEIQCRLYEGDFIEAQSINLPCLKKLELRIVSINNDFIRMLLSGCPVLEKLVFTYSSFEINEISSPVLKKLTINNCCLYREIEISCPSVRSLYLNTWGDLVITLKNMSTLHTVKFFWSQDDNNRNLKLLSALSNVVNLSIDTFCPEILDLLAADIPNCPTLFNLKNLELGELEINRQWKLVVSLLQHSPNLKTLTLHFCKPSEDETEPELPGDASFLLEYLETVKLKFEFSICEFKNLKEFKEQVVRTLHLLVKSIGEIIIS